MKEKKKIETLFVEWSDKPPTEQGWYWHWVGDDDHAPYPMCVMWSGTSRKCFVHPCGTESAIDCDEYGGLWARMPEPSTYEVPHPSLKQALPVVLYFNEDSDREEFIQAVLEVKPNMRAVKL